MKFFKRGELKDAKIIEALRQSAELYTMGCVAEVKDTLLDIVLAIREFEREVERQNGRL